MHAQGYVIVGGEHFHKCIGLGCYRQPAMPVSAPLVMAVTEGVFSGRKASVQKEIDSLLDIGHVGQRYQHASAGNANKLIQRTMQVIDMLETIKGDDEIIGAVLKGQGPFKAVQEIDVPAGILGNVEPRIGNPRRQIALQNAIAAAHIQQGCAAVLLPGKNQLDEFVSVHRCLTPGLLTGRYFQNKKAFVAKENRLYRCANRFRRQTRQSSAMPKILYILTAGRKKRLAAIGSGNAPEEMFYGYPYLDRRGYRVDLLEANNPDDNPALGQSKHTVRLPTPFNIHSRLRAAGQTKRFFIAHLNTLNSCDAIVACPAYLGLSLAGLRRTGLLRTPVIYIGMGVPERVFQPSGPFSFAFKPLRSYYERRIAGSAANVLLGRGHYDALREAFPRLASLFHFIPFGIDTRFWQPGNPAHPGRTILFVGNDANRDYELLCAIARSMPGADFSFITKRLRPQQVPPNATVRRGEWTSAPIPDTELRDLYRQSAMVIIPIRNVLQPSGQSVALQAMACGSPVIISRTDGFWDPGHFVHMRHLVFVEKAEAADWVRAITDLQSSESRRRTIAEAGRRLVRERYGAEHFAQSLEHVLQTRALRA